MSDPISDLEQQLTRVVPPEEWPRLFETIDHWRHTHGGDRVYIATKCKDRRDEVVKLLKAEGVATKDIAKKLGITPQHVRRISSSSSYL
jgi:DNA invertase Pin-like site-specific DNA recombinase